jgi:medium-chain acyl-[acyl-carrier-protein] hydrolase
VSSAWFVRPVPRPFADLRLFCLPHAGVGASVYRPWAAAMPADVELVAVQPPGRETRLREPAFSGLDELVDALLDAMTSLLDRPFALFGHSMGACVAYEAARRMESAGLPAPERLFVSGRRAPSVPATDPPMNGLSDDAFIAEIQRRYGGIPAEVLRHPELVALLLPTLRADIQALERHVHQRSAPLRAPIFALGGAQDPVVSADGLAAWRSETASAFALRLFPGGHFYLQTTRDTVIETVTSALRAAPSGREPEWTGA